MNAIHLLKKAANATLWEMGRAEQLSDNGRLTQDDVVFLHGMDQEALVRNLSDLVCGRCHRARQAKGLL